jgi:predicted DNA-binding protein (UPF0251 family)
LDNVLSYPDFDAGSGWQGGHLLKINSDYFFKCLYMVRPKMRRRLRFRARVHYFKPRGIPMRHLEEVVLTKEETETLKLKDFDELDQTEAAKKMKTSQSTFQRILFSARAKVSCAIIEGKALRIEE